jgi:hypothetical protein
MPHPHLNTPYYLSSECCVLVLVLMLVLAWVLVLVFKTVLCVDRRIFRAAANAERGSGVVIAASCHRALLLWGRWGHGGGIQSLRSAALPRPDAPSTHLKCTVVGILPSTVNSPEVNRIVCPVAVLSDWSLPQTHRTEWFSYTVEGCFGVTSIELTSKRQHDRNCDVSYNQWREPRNVPVGI